MGKNAIVCPTNLAEMRGYGQCDATPEGDCHHAGDIGLVCGEGSLCLLKLALSAGVFRLAEHDHVEGHSSIPGVFYRDPLGVRLSGLLLLLVLDGLSLVNSRLKVRLDDDRNSENQERGKARNGK